MGVTPIEIGRRKIVREYTAALRKLLGYPLADDVRQRVAEVKLLLQRRCPREPSISKLVTIAPVTNAAI